VATIHDVAARAGVSVATVSRVMNGHASVNAEMAGRVRQCIAELDYRPSHLARSMRTQKTGIVAVVVPDVENPFFTAVVRGIEDVARTTGMMAVLCNSDDQPEAEMRYLRLVEDQRVDGVILASSMESVTDLPMSSNRGLPPLVLIDREVPGIRADLVVVDNEVGAREATRHLLDNGATTLACITGPHGITTAERRLKGFLDAAAERGINRRDITYRHADFRTAGAKAAMREILAEGRPDAILVCNNQMTLGALQELADQGVGIPDDILVAGYDDEPWSGSWRPAITTVAQPAREVGKAAMRLLQERLEDAARPIQHITMQPALKIRESSLRPVAKTA
jgi:LacI family transcriptional regulator